MAFLNPASITLGGEDEEVLDSGSVPVVGASVVIEVDHQDEQMIIEDDNPVLPSPPLQHTVVNSPRLQLKCESSEQYVAMGMPMPQTVHQRTVQRPRVPRTTIGRILPKTKIKGAVTRKVPVEKITEDIYEYFVNEMIGSEVPPLNAEQEQILRALIHGDEYSVASEVEDELLGPIDYVIIHLPSKRFVLTPAQRQQAIEAAVDRFKDDRHPIGGCLQLIQKNYIGFPAVIKLRNSLLECLSRVAPNAVEGTPVGKKMRLAGRGAMPMGPGDDMHDGNNSAEYRSALKTLRPSPAVDPSTPVPDNQYDILAQILAGKMNVEEVRDWMVKEAIKARLTGDLEAEYWEQPGEFLSAGWRIRLRESGKIVPKKGEVDEIWRRCCEALGHTHTQKQMLAYLDERYAGVSTKSRVRIANKDVLFKGNRVQFPAKPRCLGVKPMQYVQIDMIEMEGSEYGDRCYNMALIVTDLYSQYVFGRALADAPDSSLLVRHLMDIFGAFAPPEAYRTFTNNMVIEHVMADIEKLFKIQIKNVGQGVMGHYNLRSSMYKRAEEELGSRERWVEALPFAVIEYNQRPLKGFGDVRISPFEIMFGRRPWKNVTTPPWISANEYDKDLDGEEFEEEHRRAVESIGGDFVDDRGMLMSRRTPKADPGATLASIYLGEMSDNRSKISAVLGRYPAKFDEDGHVIDPGTGYLYEIGDHVYMRNIAHKDFFSKTKKRSNVPRYFRATIGDVDYSNPDFMYRVFFWDDVTNIDGVPPDQWPDEECMWAWISPFDIAPSTPDLARRRNIAKRREMEYQCKCGYDYCELVFNEKCPFKLSQSCCQRLQMDCPFHSRKTPGNENLAEKITKDAPVSSSCRPNYIELAKKRGLSARPRTEPKHPGRTRKPRWVYQGGRLVEIPARTPYAQSSRSASQSAPTPPRTAIAKRPRIEQERVSCSFEDSFMGDYEEEYSPGEEQCSPSEGEGSSAARVIPYMRSSKRPRGEPVKEQMVLTHEGDDDGEGEPESCNTAESLPVQYYVPSPNEAPTVPCAEPHPADPSMQVVQEERVSPARSLTGHSLQGCDDSVAPIATENVLTVPIKMQAEKNTVIGKRQSAPPRRLSPE